jgi:hypothetical protein
MAMGDTGIWSLDHTLMSVGLVGVLMLAGMAAGAAVVLPFQFAWGTNWIGLAFLTLPAGAIAGFIGGCYVTDRIDRRRSTATRSGEPGGTVLGTGTAK